MWENMNHCFEVEGDSSVGIPDGSLRFLSNKISNFVRGGLSASAVKTCSPGILSTVVPPDSEFHFPVSVTANRGSKY